MALISTERDEISAGCGIVKCGQTQRFSIIHYDTDAHTSEIRILLRRPGPCRRIPSRSARRSRCDRSADRACRCLFRAYPGRRTVKRPRCRGGGSPIRYRRRRHSASVLTVMKIVLDHAHAADDAPSIARYHCGQKLPCAAHHPCCPDMPAPARPILRETMRRPAPSIPACP